MNTRTVSLLGASAFVVASVVTLSTRMVQNQRRAGQRSTASIDGDTLNKLIADFPPWPRVAALQMRAQYGVPQEATSEQLIWHNAGPFKRITATRAEHHHDFPFPHMDYLEHTIEYCLPVEKAAALSAYDSSLTFDRTRGEMSARCDLEGHNILTLNLAHDIVTGDKGSVRTSGATRRCSTRNMERTFMRRSKSAEPLNVTPVVTTAVDKLLVKGARELAEGVPVDGEQFGPAYSTSKGRGAEWPCISRRSGTCNRL
jgi:hypothetical protein